MCPGSPDPSAGLARMLGRRDWQLLHGERAALEGILSRLEPTLAIEIGTAQGGSLERIAAHSDEVHALDLSGELLSARPGNATLHVGDSRETLPALLAELAAGGREVDFALVDGDHSSAGVAADLAALLDSPAVRRGAILLHDAYNPAVRAGIEEVDPAAHAKVAAVELDFVPGRVVASGVLAGQRWGGLALVLLAEEGSGPDALAPIEFTLGSGEPVPLSFSDAAGPGAAPTAGARASVPAREALEAELARVRSSLSWRITAPLRGLKRRVRGR